MHNAIRTIAFSALLCSTAASAQSIADTPHLASPIVVIDELAPPGAIAVGVDGDRLDSARMAPGVFVADEVPLGAGITRSLLLRRVAVDPALIVEIMGDDGAGALTATHLDEEELLAASGVIFAGAVVGEPDSRAILSVGPAGLFGLVDDGAGRYIISSGRFGSGLVPLAFAPIDVDPSLLPMRDWTCFTEALPTAQKEMVGGVADLESACRQFRIAAETDFEFFQLLGGNALAAANYAILQVTAGSEILAGGPNARMGLAYLRLWGTPNDPWTATSASLQLQQFREHWIANMTGVQRDIAHFLSGRVLGGGVAWTASLCTDFTYSLSGNLNGYFPYPLIDNNLQNWDVIVVTHEIAHNLGAIHTHENGIESPDFCGWGECQVAAQGTIMSYCYICPGGMANIKLSFAPISVTKMLNYLNAIACVFTPPSTNMVAVDDFAIAIGGGTIEIDLLLNDAPANCDPVTLATLDLVSTAGGTITPTATPGRVKYKAPLGFTGQDSFAYSIEGSGVPAMGQAFIGVSGTVADINGDGHVNGLDLSILLGQWFSPGGGSDLNGDGIVNGLDMGIILGAWTG